MKSVYQYLIEENQSKEPFFKNGFSNHKSMVLYCLRAMGADDEILEYQASEERWKYYHDKYHITFNDIQVSKNRITSINWKDYLGRISYFPDYMEWIQSEDISLHSDSLIKVILPVLAQNISAALFHPLLRYAMGVDDANAKEQEIALAYWMSTAQLKDDPIPSIHQVNEDWINKVIYSVQSSANFVGVHYLTSFVAIKSLPIEIQAVLYPFYLDSLKSFAKQISIQIFVENIGSGDSEEIVRKTKDEAFKSVDDHVIKGIYALLELRKMNQFKYIDGALKKLMTTLF